MYPVFKRPATNSPRSPSSEMSPSNPASKRFKTPMMFQPTVAPSPSRRELWKQELGLDGSESDEDPTELSSDDDQPESDQQANHTKGRHSNVEFDALELELERKEKQKDALLIKLKESADKVSSYKAELERSQQAKRNQLKIMKKTYETHLSEKEECIQCLHELIEEQGNKIIDLHAKSIGESSTDDDDGVNSFRAVKKLVDKLSAAQQEKAHLTATVMKSQARMTKLEDEKEEINNKFEENKQALEKQIRKLEKELEEIKNSGQCVVSSKEDKTVIESLEQEKVMLSKEISKMENELADHKRKNLEWENRFETEVSKLRSIMKQTEEQLNKVTEAEPKVIVKTVISEETKKQVESLEVLNHDLKEKLAVVEEKLSLKTTSFEQIKLKLTSEKESLSASIAEKSSEIEKLGRKLSGLLKFENLFEESQRQVSSLEAELKTTLDSLSKTKHESKIKIEDLSQEMETRVKKAKLEAETKYATVIRQFNDLKKNSFELANSHAMIKQEYASLKYEMKSLASSIHPAMLATQKAITTAIADIDDKNKILVEKYKKEMRLRKKYHNEVVELKGNIRVFCRVRPRIKEDGDGINGENVVSFDDFDDGILTVEHKGKTKEFEVDRVFRPTSTQVEVFNEVESLVTSCIDGYNVCIFAYGQTGSGKTFTMEGTLEDPGINQRALSLLFKEISERNDWSYRISVCMMEIYNESLRDLLATKNHEGSLDIKQSKDTVFVPGLNEVEVTNASEVNNVFALGHKNRKTASTNMNEHSSRSHAILVINITGENKNTGTKTTGKLNLVDLAGSERVSKSGAEGARMKEAQNINKSLSALGDVIHSLKNKNSHIPYRNTKLTYLLQDSLGGDSKTLMVVQVAPVRKNEGETYCSLDFAQRVKSVELGQATKKIEMADRFNESLGTPKSRTPKKRT